MGFFPQTSTFVFFVLTWTLLNHAHTYNDDVEIDWIETDLQAWDHYQTFQIVNLLRKAYNIKFP